MWRLLLVGIGLVAGIQASIASTVVPGAACHSITPAQATLFEWRERGIKNSSSRDYWALCPMERSKGFSEQEFSLRVFNEGASALVFECYFREVFDNRVIQYEIVSAEIAPDKSENLSWTMVPLNANSAVNAACKLPNGLLIEALVSGPTGGNGGASDENNEVYACTTSPLEFYRSSDSLVVMKNGTELNNYDGRTWDTDESHIIFLTNTGKWYTLEDYGSLYKVDLLKEPDSCFEPDYLQVVDVILEGRSVGYVLSNGRTLYFDTAYINCSYNSVEVGHSVLFWESFVYDYLLDLNNAEVCRRT